MLYILNCALGNYQRPDIISLVMVHLCFIFSVLLALPLTLLVDMNLTPAQNHELSEFSVQEVFDSALFYHCFCAAQFILMSVQGHCVLKCCFTCFDTDFSFFSFPSVKHYY